MCAQTDINWKRSIICTRTYMLHRINIFWNCCSFKNKKNGQEIHFDDGKPGEARYRGRDHYHIPNPNKTNRHHEFIDSKGNVVIKQIYSEADSFSEGLASVAVKVHWS